MRRLLDHLYAGAGFLLIGVLLVGLGGWAFGDLVEDFFAAEATPVKKSQSGICHCPGGKYYNRTKTFTAYSTIKACLDSGGRRPTRGQGDCAKATTVPGSPESVEKMIEKNKDNPDPFIGRAVVIDGDTIKINGNRIRFEGIDAPETGQSCRDRNGKTQPCGAFATVMLKDLLFQKTVRCFVGTRDRDGRHLGSCYIMEGKKPLLDINGWMVSVGLALAYRKYSDMYVADEEAARAEKLGIHQGPFIPPWEWRRGKRLK